VILSVPDAPINL